MKDNLKQCPCGKSDACYEQRINSFIWAYLCYGCGFWSNSIMKSGQQFLKEQKEISPELYKEAAWEDDKGKTWMPKVINIPEKGMVFLSGTNKNDIKWIGVLSKEIPEEERTKYPDPKNPGHFYKYKVDNTTKKEFDRYNYIDALTYIGILPQDEIIEENK